MARDEKTCPKCAEQVKSAAQVCKHCGYTFTAEDAAALKAESDARSKRYLIAAGGVLFLFLIIGMCSSGEGDPPVNPIGVQSTEDSAVDARIAETDAIQSDIEGSWTYYNRRDELRGRPEYFAEVISSNEERFDFPYEGGSRLRMTIRQSSQHGQDLIFRISSGQFVCGVYNCDGAISFDGAVEKLTLSSPADHSSDVLFATYDQALVRKLKSSDRTIVELPFYQAGNRQFVFDTRGLEWPPESAD
jgi:hypothetical protein